MKNLLYIAISLFIFILGCSSFEAKDTKYYLEHAKLAESRVQECTHNGFASENERKDCSNALKAVNEIRTRSNIPTVH
jgi:hypothetical protein